MGKLQISKCAFQSLKTRFCAVQIIWKTIRGRKRRFKMTLVSGEFWLGYLTGYEPGEKMKISKCAFQNLKTRFCAMQIIWKTIRGRKRRFKMTLVSGEFWLGRLMVTKQRKTENF